MTQDPIHIRRPGGTRRSFGPWTVAALFGWSIAFLILTIRMFRLVHRGTTFDCYIDAGQAWRDSRAVYVDRHGMGFVYSPLIAAYFAIYAFFPVWMGKVAWLLTNLGLLLSGTWAVMRENVFRIDSDRARALVLILLLPLSLAGLDVAQSNSAMIGLLLLAIAFAAREKWTLCVIAISIATYLKLYPLALGLTLCVYRPREVPWRLIVALLAFGLFSLVLQHPHYVLGQYHAWIATRFADDRRLDSARRAPLDLWYLLVRMGNLPISEHIYTAIQMMAGAAIAGSLLLQKAWTARRRLAGVFLLCTCWMILLGPATESYTYAILAPAMGLGIAAAFTLGASPAARALVCLSSLLLLAAQVKNSIFTKWQADWFNITKPIGALVFVAFAILWLLDDKMWKTGIHPTATQGDAIEPALAQ
jgi:hypothetical protein